MNVSGGLSVPWDLWDLDAAARRGRLEAIADAGIDHLFTADHISFHDGSRMDAPVLLAALSGIEPRLGLHAGVEHREIAAGSPTRSRMASVGTDGHEAR